MRTIEQGFAWAVMLILVFLILSRAAEANTIINTIGGFVSAETRNLQGYDPYGKLVSSPATSRLNNPGGYTGPGSGVLGPNAGNAWGNIVGGIFGG